MITINKMEIAKQTNRILKIILKDFTAKHSVTSVSKEIGMTRQGTFKALKKLESERMLILSPVGAGKTSTYTISLNWENPIVEKMLAVLLVEESLKKKKWISNFAELADKVDFLIIYGSILNSPKEANDIDTLNVVSDKKKFVEIEKITTKIQKTQLKKIHALNLTPMELKQELEKYNKAFIDAIKKGVILFGQEKFIEFIKGLIQK